MVLKFRNEKYREWIRYTRKYLDINLNTERIKSFKLLHYNKISICNMLCLSFKKVEYISIRLRSVLVFTHYILTALDENKYRVLQNNVWQIRLQYIYKDYCFKFAIVLIIGDLLLFGDGLG